jgi:DNA-binding NarL/FixJ family response regulator
VTPIRVLVVDDHPIFRMGIAAAIDVMDAIELVGEAASAAEARELVVTTAPHIVLLDIHLPDDSGVAVNRWLAAEHPHVKVVMLTMTEDQDTLLVVLRDGARGYLVKGDGPDRVERALRAVAAGDVVLHPSVAAALAELAHVRASAGRSRAFPQLTPRELDILDLVAHGLDNQAIARRLVLSPKTVRNQVSTVLTKIHAPDRSHAIVLGRDAGLGGSAPGVTAG